MFIQLTWYVARAFYYPVMENFALQKREEKETAKDDDKGLVLCFCAGQA